MGRKSDFMSFWLSTANNMAYIKRIIFLLLTVHWIELASPKPLFTEVNFKKSFEVFKHHGHHHPIRAHFFKEKSFGIKHKIFKRSSEDIPHSKFESLQIPVGEGEDLSRLPAAEEEEDQKAFASELVPVPVVAPPLPPATVIITPPPKVKPVVPFFHTEVASIGPIPEILKPVEEEIIEPIEKVPLIEEKVVPLPGIGVEIEKPKEEVPLHLPPPPPPPVEKVVEKVVESPVGKGSRLALFFGDLILQVLSQFLANAHTTLSKFLENPPKI